MLHLGFGDTDLLIAAMVCSAVEYISQVPQTFWSMADVGAEQSICS